VDADVVDWSQITAIAGALAAAVAADRPPDVVVGVLRGGMIPAVLLAHHLGVRDVRAVAVTHTEADGVNAAKTSLPTLLNPASLGDVAGRDVLVVDDVAGTGETLEAARSLVCAGQVSAARTVVCVLNEANWPAPAVGQRTPTYIGRRVQRWVVFPWERS
jgi:hypoxanthine phosphoribosyltransferase